MIGRTAALAGAGGWKGLSGCAGVAKAGEDEGMALDGAAFLGAKKGGGGGFARLLVFSGLVGCFFLEFFSGLCITIILSVLLYRPSTSSNPSNAMLGVCEVAKPRKWAPRQRVVARFGGAQGAESRGADRGCAALRQAVGAWHLKLFATKLQP